MDAYERESATGGADSGKPTGTGATEQPPIPGLRKRGGGRTVRAVSEPRIRFVL